MAHFAQIDTELTVTQVIVVNNAELLDEFGVEQEMLGRQFCTKLLGGNWVQTSYNGNFRKNFAGIGFKYDPQLDAFIPPTPYPSWILNTDTCQWDAPVPYPDDGKAYLWDEDTTSWIEVIITE
jgi:hypothetical protein